MQLLLKRTKPNLSSSSVQLSCCYFFICCVKVAYCNISKGCACTELSEKESLSCMSISSPVDVA